MKQQPTTHYIFEKAIHGRKTYSYEASAYTDTPIFITIIFLKNSVNMQDAFFRVTDVLSDITSGIVLSDEYPIPRLQKHDYIELAYVKSGSLKIQIKNESFTFPAGSAFSLDLGLENMLLSGDYEVFFLALSNNFFKLWPMNYEAKAYKKSLIMNHVNRNLSSSHLTGQGFLSFVPKKPSDIEELLKQLQQELSEKRDGYSMMLYGLVFRIFMCLENSDYFATHYTNLEQLSTSKLAEAIFTYLSSHPYRLTLSELTRELNYSETYLSKVYREHTGESIMNANRRIYLEEAQHLLSVTTLTVEQICKKLHFRNRKAFYDVFQTSFGCTPRQYRQKHQTNQYIVNQSLHTPLE